MDPEKNKQLGQRRNRRCKFVSGLLVAIGIIAIVVPTTVVEVLKHKKLADMGPKAKVFVPLYVYPSPGAWGPLEQVVEAHPDLNFTVVINPGNGPGPNALPDANYTREIPRLSSYSNVRLIGYVATTYGTRNISLVNKDIETYTSWPTLSNNANLSVSGIFFDETPQLFNASHQEYYEELTALVKQSKGLGPDNFVVHNPGSVPDSRYLATVDSTVVFEDTYATFLQRNDDHVFTQIPNFNRSTICTIIHSIPENVQDAELKSLVGDARKVSDEVFLTHLDTGYYSSFGPNWSGFIDLMASD
ncbi:Spherulation-specific family 4 [Talaromyces proteolyticus]|uniref:Spherulation-specific family 4 n=1 Tax=Talaromyces proteolyticus TaxID=1131652 RepID=A0AAD4KQV5_9EURO|nr:Spherulation-specific family 4 [Talaromyces proteolyticus]KAH8694064.1 Spherulation-specific family 4 [Talaromyces proteolyticus]